MRFLLAILVPPVAVLLCGKPVQSILNFVLWLCCLVPGMIHAVLVVNQRIADERQAALISTMSGKPPTITRANGVAVALMTLVCLGAVIVAFSLTAGIIADKLPQSPSTSKAPAVTKPAWTAPNIIGWDMAQVEAVYGSPLAKDKATGLASWHTADAAFTAHFTAGAVDEVKELKN